MMTEHTGKKARLGIKVNDDIRIMLEKLTKIHDRSMTGVIEQLIKKEAKEYGLIESRKETTCL